MVLYADILLPLPIDHTFTYSVPEDLQDRVKQGCRVLVPFGSRQITGCIVGFTPTPPALQVREIIKVLDDTPALDPGLLELTKWVSRYYFSPWGEVLKAVLPGGMLPKGKQLCRKTKEGQKVLEQESHEPGNHTPMAGKQNKTTGMEEEGYDLLSGFDLQKLTPGQAEALDTITQVLERGQFQTILLQGVTGSGKTEIYLRAITLAITRGKQALLLVPEIVLTSRPIELLQERFGNRVAILHSGLRPSQRRMEWAKIRAQEVAVAVGTRSAVFAPFQNLGLIVVDEEHDSSYKQEERPRYNARDVAIMRGKLSGSLVILGSATPSLESIYNVRKKKYQHLILSKRVYNRPLPTVVIVDLKKEKVDKEKPVLLSRVLREAIEDRLARGEQSLLLLNRRGFAPFIQCIECGFVFQCLNCDVSLIYHRSENLLCCHYCGGQVRGSDICPQCRGVKIIPFGLGTQRVEEELRRIFAGAKIARLDRDIARKKRETQRILEELKEGTIDILVGTQLIAKGHDYHRITLVGVISADVSLNIPDFRAAERTYQLITQVAGRAGRGDLKGEVIVQTYYPQHYAIQSAKDHDYEGFCRQELAFRRRLNYPPFTRMVAIKIESPNQEVAQEAVSQWGQLIHQIRDHHDAKVEILGPSSAIRGKIRNRYRWQILLKSGQMRILSELTKEFLIKSYSSPCKNTNIKINIDVDPIDLL
jgi:primosomal protein N' (replication factor Y)